MKSKLLKLIMGLSKHTLYILIAQIASAQFLLANETLGQSLAKVKMSISVKNASLEEVLSLIEQQTDFVFVARGQTVNSSSRIDMDLGKSNLKHILEELSEEFRYNFKRINKNIYVWKQGENGGLPDGKFEDYFWDREISGKITDDNGEGLPGASIIVKGTSNGTVTDHEGNYRMNVPEDAILVVSFVGYLTQEISLDGRSTIDVQLMADLASLQEVVVIGYGSKRKADITSAVSVVDMDNIGDVPASNASRLLVGQAAGVVVKQTSGRPGEEMEITIRGVGSLGTGQGPLFVVDGFPAESGIMQNLNPDDIENITVLKDAASTAIYGARGSNGVVLITTKSAEEGEVSITATANYGIQNIPDSRKTVMMNGVEFAQFKKESFMDKIRYFEGREPTIDEVPEDYRFPENTRYSTNWFDEIINNNASFQNYNITLASGKSNIKSLVSLGYTSQEGAVIETGFNRFNLRANINGQVNDFISMGLILAGSRSSEDYSSTDGRDAIIGKALWADPRFPVYNEDGSFNDYIGGNGGVFGSTNPVQELHEHDKVQDINNVISNAFVEVAFLKDFKFRSSVAISYSSERQNEFRPSTLAGNGFNRPPPRNATLIDISREILNVSTDQLLTYSKSIGQHQFDVMLGYVTQEETERQLRSDGNIFPNDQVRFLEAAEIISTVNDEEEWALLASFARVNYNFKGKYLVSASFRREGSSRFGENSKYGNFPAVSVGWRLSEEQFMSNLSWLTDLKLRGSFGITGNNAIGNYNNSSILNTTGYIIGGQFAPGQVLSSFVNNNIGWEESDQIDIGLDLGAFNNKLNITAEWYQRTTDNMLLEAPLPIITGFNSTLTNLGKVENKGFEFAVGYRTNISKDFNLRSNFNIAFNRNKVLEINGDNDELWNGSFYGVYNRSVIGRPIGMLTGYRVLGIFNTDEEIANSPTQDGAVPGVYKYWDANGDGVISYNREDDMVEVGNPHPDFVWGLTLGADFKGFDLNILMTGAQNYDIMRDIEKTTMNMDGVFNILQSGKNRWRSAENPGDGRGPTSNHWKWQRESNSRYIYDASHAWLKSVTIGYTIPRTISVLGGTRFYVNADNLLLITDYPGGNPEANNSGDGRFAGRDDEAYPVPRTFTVGASITL